MFRAGFNYIDIFFRIKWWVHTNTFIQSKSHEVNKKAKFQMKLKTKAELETTTTTMKWKKKKNEILFKWKTVMPVTVGRAFVEIEFNETKLNRTIVDLMENSTDLSLSYCASCLIHFVQFARMREWNRKREKKIILLLIEWQPNTIYDT